jgi:hypothetical protein
VIEVLPTASAKDALLGVGILTDKLQLLSGDMTARVEHVERVDIFSDWPQVLEKYLPSEKAREIDLEPGSNLLTANGAGDATRLIEGGAEGDQQPQTDSGSDDRPAIRNENGLAAANCRQGAVMDGKRVPSCDQTLTRPSGAAALTEADV